MNRLLCVLALCAVATGCSSVSPSAGEEAVLVEKPWFFGSGGVDQNPLKPGLTWVAFSTQHILVNMRPELAHVKFNDLMTKDGVPLEFDSAIQFQIADSVRMVAKFGDLATFFSNNVEQPFRNFVRDEVKKHGMNEMAINAAASEDVDRALKAATEKLITDNQLPMKLLNVTLGRANPPDAIKHQRVATAEQEQRQQTEQQAKLAEDQRREHEKSRASADNAYREAMSMTPDQFIKLKTIEMQTAACSHGGCTFIVGTNAVPTFDVKK